MPQDMPGRPLTDTERLDLEAKGFKAPPAPPPGRALSPEEMRELNLQPAAPGTGLQNPRVAERFPEPTISQAIGAGGADFPDPRGFVPTPTVADIAQEFGIAIEPPAGFEDPGMMAKARLLANMGIGIGGSPQELREVQFALQNTFNIPVEVRLGPETGELEFRPQGMDQFALFNQPGLTTADLAAAAPEAAVIGTQIAAGAGGFAAGAGLGPGGAITGAALSEGIATFGAELVKGKLAIDAGLPIDPDDVFDVAFQNAGLATAGAIALPLAAGMFKRLFVGRVPRALRDVDLEQLGASLEDLGGLQAELRRRAVPPGGATPAGQPEFRATVGQLTRDVEIQSAESFLARRGAGKALRAIGEDQDEVIDGFLKQIFSETRSPVQDEPLGNVIQQIARQGPEGRARAERISAAAAEDLANRQTDVLLMEAAPVEAAAKAARENVRVARTIVFAPFGRRYDELDALTPGVDVNQAGLRDAAQAFADEQGGVVFPSLLEEASPQIREAMRAGIREEQRLVFGADNVLQWVTRRAEEPVPLSYVQKDLSNLRDQLRSPNLDAKKRRVLETFRQRLLDARNDALKDNPNAMQVIQELERDYEKAKDLFDRGFVGELLQTVEGGGFKLKDEKIVRRLLANPTEAVEFMASTGNPSVTAGMAARRQVKQGIWDTLSRQLQDRTSERSEASVLATFWRNHESSLRLIMTPDEIKKLQNVRAAKQAALDAVEREKEVVATLNKTMGMEIQRLDPTKLVEQMVRGDRPRDLVRLREIMANAGGVDEVAQLDARLAQEVKDRLTIFDPGTNREIPRLKEVRAFLGSKLVPTVEQIFGKQFTSDLRLLQQALEYAEANPIRSASDITDTMRASDGLRGLSRFLRVALPPLSPRGRALSATVANMHERAQMLMAEALSNPESLHAFMRLRQMPLASSPATVITGGVFGPQVMDMLEIDLGRTAPDELRGLFGPAGAGPEAAP